MFDAIRSVKHTTANSVQACIKSKNGEILEQREEILERWREYRAELFKRPEDEEPLQEETIPVEQQEPPPSLSEVEDAIKQPGIDAIPA